MKPTSRPNGEAASANITKRIQELGDWRGETLAHVRQLIHDADPDIQEEWKWMGTPVWSHDGGVCTGESYKQVVKLTFFSRSLHQRPEEALQFQPGREHAACDRPPRRGEDQRSCLQATHPRRGGGQLRSARSTGSQEEVSPALRGMTYERPFATEGELWDVGRSWRIPPTSVIPPGHRACSRMPCIS